MKNLVRSFSLMIAVAFFVTNTFAQQTAKQAKKAAQEAAVAKAVDAKKYTFVATYMQPLRGAQKYLSDDYDLKITPDSAIAWLPYYGRVFMNPPMNPDDAGIKFTSTKFDYNIAPRKKGGWEVIIVPKGDKYTSKMRLDIYTDGGASLMVMSNYRDQITFTGHLKGFGR